MMEDYIKSILLIMCIAVAVISGIILIVVQFIPVEGDYSLISLEWHIFIHYWYINLIFITSLIGTHLISADLRKNSNDRRWEEAKEKFRQSKKNLNL